MTSEEILHALRSGEISLEDAKKALTVETSQVLGDGQKEALPGAAREVEPVKRASSAQEAGRRGAVAIVGMSARYPDASSLSDFWGNLVQGKNAIREIPLSRFNIADSYDQS